MRSSPRPECCGIAVVLICCATAACSVYDAARLRVTPAVPLGDGSANVDAQAQPAADGSVDLDARASLDATVPADACIADPNAPERQCCPETCDGKDNDCDDIADEGEQSDLCQLAFATSLCVAGNCVVASCVQGRVDCNGDASDGCETSLDVPNNCGVCGRVCSLPHASAACMDADCVVDACQNLFGDCNGKPEDGCEAPLDTLSNCAACGRGCSLSNASTTCSQGHCAFSSCQVGFGDCNNDSGKLDGDGCETALNTATNCGACGQTCSGGTPYCSGGKCTALACPADKADCDADNLSCETDLRSVASCGGCGKACGALANAGPSCASGRCEPVCNAGFQNCDQAVANGCETDVHTTTNCGGCNQACTYRNATTSCTTGSCKLVACIAGYGDCNANLQSDGCEQPLNTNSHCGQCGKVCALANAVASCSSSTCQVSSCATGFGNCDASAANGCEINLNTSNQNCGKCGQVCPSNRTCVAGACVCTSNANCSSGQVCCNGACVDTRSDEANCGSCGQACASGQTCCSGSCANLATDFDNCGSCGAGCDSHDADRCTSGRCMCHSENVCGGLRRCCSNGCSFGFCN